MSLQSQTIRYVKPFATGTGSNWSNASGDIQAMINTSDSGDLIYVAEGIYKPRRSAFNLLVVTDTNARSNAYVMKNGVSLFGGFPATGNPVLADRDPIARKTILSGDLGITGNITDNAYHVVIFSNVSNVSLDGFYVRDANANEAFNSTVRINNYDVPLNKGAGVFIYAGTGNSLKRNRVVGNVSSREAGGIYVNGGECTLESNNIDSNTAVGYGGGVYFIDGKHKVLNNFFSKNKATVYFYYAQGGAVFAQRGNHYIAKNMFDSNEVYTGLSTANAAGGAIYTDAGEHEFIENIFKQNKANGTGSILTCSGGALNLIYGKHLILNNQFLKNECKPGSGGALYLLGGKYNVFNNIFKENTAIIGGALKNTDGAGHYANNVFLRNESVNNGGAIHTSGNSVVNNWVNNTFFTNKSIQNGGAIYLDNSRDSIVNNVFWRNSAANGSEFGSNSSVTVILHNVLQSGSGSSGGNIYGQDPKFKDSSSDNLTLQINSPAINSGLTAVYRSFYPAKDCNDDARVKNDTIDMGAYEAERSLGSAKKGVRSRILNVFPNPVFSGEYLYIISEKPETINLLNLQGHICMTFKIHKGLNSIRLPELSAGIYCVISNSGLSQQLIIE